MTRNPFSSQAANDLFPENQSNHHKREQSMQLTIQGKQIDLGDALRTHVTDKLEDINQKFFNHATFATVTFSREGHGHGQIKAHIQIRIGKNIMVIGESLKADAYGSFDTAAEKVTNQLRRYKNRLRDHHERLDDADIETASYNVLSAEPENAEAGEAGNDDHKAAPLVIAEMTTVIQTMSVSEAAMRLDLADQPALIFRNASHGGLNMIYKRDDGNVGWIDPEGNDRKKSEAKKETKKPAVKKPAAKKPVAKKAVKKPAAKKPAVKKAAAPKKAKPVKATAKKSTPKKAPAKKPMKKSAVKKPVAKKIVKAKKAVKKKTRR